MNPYFAIVGQLNLLDSGFCFFLVASVFAFLRARDSEPESRAETRWMLAASVALGLAVLSKGIAALVLIAGTVLGPHVGRAGRPAAQAMAPARDVAGFPGRDGSVVPGGFPAQSRVRVVLLHPRALRALPH